MADFYAKIRIFAAAFEAKVPFSKTYLLKFLSRITTSEKKTSRNPKTQRSRTVAQTSP